MGLSQSLPTPAPFPLTPFEVKARNHAHIMFFAYLVGLPLGVCLARYLRTFMHGWLLPHALVNGLFVGPLVIAGYALGFQTTTAAGLPHFTDPHQKIGLALFVMYLIQVLLGVFIHWVKIPAYWKPMLGHRPQNFVHIALGLSILALASYQTHYGLFTEWGLITGNVHPTSIGCRRFWLAFVVVSTWLFVSPCHHLPSYLMPSALLIPHCFAFFSVDGLLLTAIPQITWGFYIIGLALLPRQVRQERRALELKDSDSTEGKAPIAQSAA
ncbi:uncharacterized protein BXZ73DRAFT_91003 [Epithele typhae]|uniref:uncharacterized protein n=1 Tax=Epithele typhae TaxID=378194 RepID=UPI002007E765|nr:uncharacterized protein BXZ73DRAFT_91003 [Epithele typhae]KAH9925866.1 hypothetical protein BXZ73DRAFT_91003 [Epithele typhae]